MALHTYIGECCREWPMAFGYKIGRCGLCGERPTFKREDDDCRCEDCRSEPLAGGQVDNSPLELPEALQGALERLSGALEDQSDDFQGFLQAVWDAEDELTSWTLDER